MSTEEIQKQIAELQAKLASETQTETKTAEAPLGPFALFKKNPTVENVDKIRALAKEGAGKASLFLYLLYRDGYKDLEYAVDAKKADIHLSKACEQNDTTAITIAAEKSLAGVESVEDAEKALADNETKMLKAIQIETESGGRRDGALELLLGVMNHRAGKVVEAERLMQASTTCGNARGFTNLIALRLTKVQAMCVSMRQTINDFMGPAKKEENKAE